MESLLSDRQLRSGSRTKTKRTAAFEEERIKQFGFRFYPLSTPEKEAYDKAQVGDRLEVRYRYMGDKKEIISIRNLTHPDS